MVGGVGGVAFGVNWAYLVLGIAFSTISNEYQWILALLSPLVREFWLWISPKGAFKASGENTIAAKYLCQHFVETKHAVFLAVILGGVATPETTYCILALDSLINLYHAVKIAIKSKNGSLTKEKGAQFLHT